MDKEGLSNLERRRFPRLKENIFIFGKLKLTPIEEFKAITQNISAGGLMFETERDIPQDSELELEIYQPMDRDKRVIFSILVWPKIIWIQKIEKEKFEQGENRCRIGIEFSEIKEEDKQRIARYVKENVSEK
jgi:c-di-GMP-binding flagellar brake protein YcgR